MRPGEPSTSPVLQSLNYLIEENLLPKDSNGGSLFGGYPSLEERDKSYDIQDSMTVHCGYADESHLHVSSSQFMNNSSTIVSCS